MPHLIEVVSVSAQREQDATAGVKHDGGKPRMDLLDPIWLEGVADVMGFGAAKYAVHNWRKGMAHSRLYAATQRHLNAFAQGFTHDDESGLHHLLHASCCLMMLYNLTQTRPDLNDLYWSDDKAERKDE